MSQLTAQIEIRTHEALASLHDAVTADDHHLVVVRTGELESLARTATDHDLDIPALRPYAPIAC